MENRIQEGFRFRLLEFTDHRFTSFHLVSKGYLDLGVYSNALYDYARFRMNDAASFKMMPLNLLSDHMDFSLMLLSPFSLIFGQYTLLIWQIISVIIGGFGVYHFLLAYTGDKRLSALAGMHLFLFFGIFSALSFDYHSNVYASMLIPWFLLNSGDENGIF